MKEIKFRVWDTAMEKFVGSEFLHLNFDGSIVKVFDSGRDVEEWTPNNQAVLQQYTGLKDKNGQEIYEGDILYHRPFVSWSREDGDSYKDIYAEVIWGHGGFTIKKVRDEHFTTFDWTRYEVIGNIYENPDLLS